MKRGRCIRIVLGLLLGLATCSRANLDVISRPPGVDAGPDLVGGVKDSGAVPIDAGVDVPIDAVLDLAGDVKDSGAQPIDVGRDAQVCPTPAHKTGDSNETVQVNGTSRTYLLHVPASYNGSAPVPLILDFHYLSMTGARERSISPYPAVTDPESVIMAFPDGVAGPAGTGWNVGPCCVDKSTDDVAFARALVAQVKANTCIDANRIYAVGSSLGGGMAYYLGCRAADMFAAVASAGFDLAEEQLPDCKPVRPVPVISFRGTADPLVPYDGGLSTVVPRMPVTFLGAKATFDTWADLDGCTDLPSPEDGNGCSRHSACGDDAEVILCTKQGGGQDSGNAGLAWSVLKRHSL
jgi:polyhydroxybutyrate depolymerase